MHTYEGLIISIKENKRHLVFYQVPNLPYIFSVLSPTNRNCSIFRLLDDTRYDWAWVFAPPFWNSLNSEQHDIFRFCVFQNVKYLLRFLEVPTGYLLGQIINNKFNPFSAALPLSFESISVDGIVSILEAVVAKRIDWELIPAEMLKTLDDADFKWEEHLFLWPFVTFGAFQLNSAKFKALWPRVLYQILKEDNLMNLLIVLIRMQYMDDNYYNMLPQVQIIIKHYTYNESLQKLVHLVGSELTECGQDSYPKNLLVFLGSMNGMNGVAELVYQQLDASNDIFCAEDALLELSTLLFNRCLNAIPEKPSVPFFFLRFLRGREGGRKPFDWNKAKLQSIVHFLHIVKDLGDQKYVLDSMTAVNLPHEKIATLPISNGRWGSSQATQPDFQRLDLHHAPKLQWVNFCRIITNLKLKAINKGYLGPGSDIDGYPTFEVNLMSPLHEDYLNWFSNITSLMLHLDFAQNYNMTPPLLISAKSWKLLKSSKEFKITGIFHMKDFLNQQLEKLQKDPYSSCSAAVPDVIKETPYTAAISPFD